MFTRWVKRYESFAKRRFVKMSRGGWKPLAASTLKGRRGGKGKRRKAAILIDTGTLVKSLTIGATGNMIEWLRNGVRYGIGGPAKHPDGKATIADIARFHDSGKGRLPKREIIVAPDAATVNAMKRDVKSAVTALGQKYGG